jgi:hypothetical protein
VDQQPLFFEDVYDAFRNIVRVVGPKEAGIHLFPKKQDPAAAARSLADNLNPDRGEKLDLEQVIQLLRLGKDKGCHSAMDYICHAAGYSKPAPIEPDDEKAELQRQLIRVITEHRQLVNRLGLDSNGTKA